MPEPTKVWLVMHYDYSQTDYVGIFDSFEAILDECPDFSKQWWEQDKSGGYSRKFPAVYGPGLDSDYYAEEVEVQTVASLAEKKRVKT